MAVYNNLYDLIGNTPMLKLCRLKEKIGFLPDIFAKLEYFNPLGSIKDRVGFTLIAEAEKRGAIDKDTVIIEPTSGNTGIGLATVCAQRGYRLILTMPESMSLERRQLLKALGAEIVLTESAMGMSGAISEAERLMEIHQNSFMPNQFENRDNVKTHRESTAVEILRDCGNNIDYFVCSVGTGGTISGVGQALKQYIPSIKIIAVEPLSSAVMSGSAPGPHKIQGIGAGFISGITDLSVIDDVIAVPDNEAFEFSRLVCKTEGLPVGISSGAALYAAIETAKKSNRPNVKIVTIFPDTGERYLSAGLYQ